MKLIQECPKCFEEAEEASLYCMECGERLNRIEGEEKDSFFFFLIIRLLIILIVMLFVLISFF